MSKNMVERVARIIGRDSPPSFLDLQLARAAIEAMREPTEEMEHAAFDVPARSVAGAYAPDGDIEIEENGPKLIWQAMIDAALKP